MRPRLLVLSGPLKDSTIPLAEGEVTIGREASNGIALADPSVSRKHCRVSWQEGRFRVRDLESRNGTLVNGSGVEEQWLEHGDEIATGDSSFLFLVEDESLAPAAGRVEFEEAQFTAETTVLYPRDIVYLQPDRLLQELPATSRVARNLNAELRGSPLEAFTFHGKGFVVSVGTRRGVADIAGVTSGGRLAHLLKDAIEWEHRQSVRHLRGWDPVAR